MGRHASSDRDRGNVAGRWALRAGDPGRVAPAAASLHGDGGNEGAFAGHVVGERGRTEADLAFAASIVESSDDAVIGKTLDGIITLWNAGAERLYGYKAHEVIGWPIALIIPRELDAELR
jgi:PAS domain-containing protein